MVTLITLSKLEGKFATAVDLSSRARTFLSYQPSITSTMIPACGEKCNFSILLVLHDKDASTDFLSRYIPWYLYYMLIQKTLRRCEKTDFLK